MYICLSKLCTLLGVHKALANIVKLNPCAAKHPSSSFAQEDREGQELSVAGVLGAGVTVAAEHNISLVQIICLVSFWHFKLAIICVTV